MTALWSYTPYKLHKIYIMCKKWIKMILWICPITTLVLIQKVTLRNYKVCCRKTSGIENYKFWLEDQLYSVMFTYLYQKLEESAHISLYNKQWCSIINTLKFKNLLIFVQAQNSITIYIKTIYIKIVKVNNNKYAYLTTLT